MSGDILKGVLPSSAALRMQSLEPKEFSLGQRKDSPEQVQAAAEQFESMLLSQMMNSMWQTVSTEGTLLGSREEEMYRDMFNQALSESIAKGQGIGIKGVISRELTHDAEKKVGGGSLSQLTASILDKDSEEESA
jgi:flagellar protein FlgJ